MADPPIKRPVILFLFSDTGGGHRSAAEAIIEALYLEYGDQLRTEMVDIFKDYAPRPLNYLPDLYPKMVRTPRAWGLGYHLSDGQGRSRMITASAWPYVERSIRRLLARHPSDLIVSVHPLANAPVLRALGKYHPPFITVVTDLVSVHALWFHRRVNLCVVPTEAAQKRALQCGLHPAQIRVVGLPVADRFCQPPGDKTSLREKLLWPQDRPMILLVGGGDGMGPIERTAVAIDQAGLRAGLAVIAGRNQRLKGRLESRSWSIPVHVYGFVHDMPDFMAAADILVTKAGPGTITEAMNAGLPIILYSKLPGQEDGNVAFVVSEGAGIWAPTPERIIFALRSWLEQPDTLARAAKNSHNLANPRAARQIASILVERLGIAQSGLSDLQANPNLSSS